MSVVIIGGHDRMVCQYKQICKQFKCKAKVFTQMSAGEYMCAGVSFLDVRGDISERKAEAVKKTRLWQYNGTGGKEFFKQILCRLYRCK